MDLGPGLSRRELLRVLGGSLGPVQLARTATFSPPLAAGTLGIPGLFPGRVIGIEHRGALVSGNYRGPVIEQMFQRGMAELAGTPAWQDAWRLFFEPGDVVGIKVNPAGLPHIVSSPEILWQIVQGLEAAGIKRNDIVIYDRYREEFLSAGMGQWVPQGARTMFAADRWEQTQQAIDGYDPDHFMEMAIGLPGQNVGDPTVCRSYAAEFITKAVNKLVNLTVLKDHQAAGVTLALKNLSNGLVNNVNRSHPDYTRNYTGSFIPAVVSIPAIRNKAVLHIIDGVKGLYHSGPHAQPQFLWEHCTLYFASDPVALDRVGWTVIDQKRVSVGMKPVQLAPADEYSHWQNRQPEHIEIAGMMGLGEWDPARIYYRHIRLDAPASPRSRGEDRIALPTPGRNR
jgi:uncharacterized protein DUF362